MVSQTLRESIRALYGFCCGYCGVTETESGGQTGGDEDANIRIHRGSP